MTDYISRQAAIDALVEWYGCEPYDLYAYQDIVNRVPPADVQPVRHGHWIYIGTEENGNAFYSCSVCGKGEIHVPIVEVAYCWNCGAKMNEGSN